MAQPIAIARDEQNRFVPGNNGGPGRPKGSRNKLGEAFIEAMYADFQEHGIKAIETVRTEKPDQYLKVVASILPKELELGGIDGGPIVLKIELVGVMPA